MHHFYILSMRPSSPPWQDAYPNRFDCSTPEIWHSVTLNYHNYHELVNPGMVWYMPEFQGKSTFVC